MHKTPGWAKNVGHDLQVQFFHEALGFLQQTRQETVDIFVLMTVKASVQSYVQDFVAKSAASPPWGTVGHQRERPLGRPRPGNKNQRSGKQLPGMPFRSYNFIIVVWGCSLVLGAEDEDNPITHSICVYARPLLNQIRDSLIAA